jgi:hypothetical protein
MFVSRLVLDQMTFGQKTNGQNTFCSIKVGRQPIICCRMTFCQSVLCLSTKSRGANFIIMASFDKSFSLSHLLIMGATMVLSLLIGKHFADRH